MKAMLLMIGFVSALGVRARAEERNWNLVELCKKDCPKAASDEEAHKCAEKKGRLNKEFRKSKCWEVNEEYEKHVGGGHKD